MQVRRLNFNNCCTLCKREAKSIEYITRECVFVKELLEAQRIHLTTQYADVPWKEMVVHESLQPVVFNSISFILASLKEYKMLNCSVALGPLRSRRSG
ncbi:hypothetical protein V6N13_057214 [Hibiscus sabdariffa]